MRRPTSCTSPTATATAASSCSTRRRGAYKRHWGAYGAAPDDTNAGAYDPAAPPAKQFRTVSCVTIARRRHRLRLRSAEQPHPGVQEGRHVREGSGRREGDARQRRGVGHCVLVRSGAAIPVRRRRHRPEGLHPAARHARRTPASSAPAAAFPASSMASAASPSIRAAISTRAKRSKASACRSSRRAVSEAAIETIQVSDEQCDEHANESLKAAELSGSGDAPRLGIDAASSLSWLSCRARRARSGRGAGRRSTVQAPKFEVDPMWPKPLPNNWLIGQAIGLAVDARDHVWIVHRVDYAVGERSQPASRIRRPARAASRAPPILEFDPDGNAAALLGRPGRRLRLAGVESRPRSSITRARLDGRQRRHRRAGAEVHAGRQVRRAVRQARARTRAATTRRTSAGRQRSSSTPKENEAYIADGYGNKRVAVIDADTGKFKRYWGAYGNKPDDTNLGHVQPRCAADAAVPDARALRGPVDRRPRLRLRSPEQPPAGVHPRRQVREGDVRSPRRRSATARSGTSRSRRTRSRSTCTSPTARTSASTSCCGETLEVLTSFGDGGRQPGQFFAVHSIATDSKGNIYHDRDVRRTASAEVRVQGR